MKGIKNMFIQKIGAVIGKQIEIRKIKKAHIEELAKDMADWLPPEAFGSFGKIGRKAVKIIAQREREAARIAKN